MTRKEVITALKPYFKIQELVCAHTYKAFGEKSWQFFDKEYLETLLILRRDIFKSPMTVNNWHAGGTFSQRGFRCNICQLTRDKTIAGKIYLTAHANGCATDSSVKGLTAAQARKKIKDNKALLPYNIRVEKSVSWLHTDIYDSGSAGKYTEFAG